MRTKWTSLPSKVPLCSFMVTKPKAPSQPSGVSEKSTTSPTTARAFSLASALEVVVALSSPPEPAMAGSSSLLPRAANRVGTAPPTRARPTPLGFLALGCATPIGSAVVLEVIGGAGANSAVPAWAKLRAFGERLAEEGDAGEAGAPA